jgi:hypothetical protein
MADTVTSQLTENGPSRWAYNFTNVSDATGEAAVVKVDGSASGPLGVTIAGQIFYPGIHITVDEIRFQVQGGAVRLLWDASAPQVFQWLVAGSDQIVFTKKGGGLFAPAGLAGATGKILLTTQGFAAGSGYSIWMFGKKGIRQ